MSGELYAEVGMINQVYSDQDNKEGLVNIYVSAESLRVYDQPWVEDKPPNTPGPAGAQHSVVSEHSGRRNRTRTDSVFLGVACLFLLAGVIFLGVQLTKNKTNWRTEKTQMMEDIVNLKKSNLRLTTNNTELSRERDNLWRKFCRAKPMRCKNLDQLDFT